MFSICGTKLADAGFFINLEKSTDRVKNINNQIINFEIKDLYRYPALTNQDMPQSSATDSHVDLFKHCLENKIETVAVFEDDFQFYHKVGYLRNNNDNLSDYIAIFLNSVQNVDWDVLFLGFNPKKTCIPINKYTARVFKSTGAWSYLIKKKAYEYIINTINYPRDRLAIDDVLPYLTYCGFNCYASTITLCHHGVNFVSTLQPSLGPIDYSEWILGNYHKNMWNSINNDTLDLDTFLSLLYDNSETARSEFVKIKKFNNDLQYLFDFSSINLKYKNCIIEIEGDLNHEIRYFMNTEASLLYHTTEGLNRLGNILPNKFIEIDYSL